MCRTVKYVIDLSYLKNKLATWELLRLNNMGDAGSLRAEQCIVPLSLLELLMIAYRRIVDR